MNPEDKVIFINEFGASKSNTKRHCTDDRNWEIKMDNKNIKRE
jgi:hypothetical protein